MSSAFVGAAAAVNADNYDDGVTFTDGSIDDNVWLGQEITLIDEGNTHDSSLVSIGEGPSHDDGDHVLTAEVDGDSVTFSENLDRLEEGTYYHIDIHNGDGSDFNFEGETFEVKTENLETEFKSDTVNTDSSVYLEVDSERDNQHLNITSSDLDATDLENIFGEEYEHPADTDEAILIDNVSDGDEINASFESIDAGDYEFEFDVSDSFASDNATINVTDEDEDFSFSDVDSISEGGIANVTIDVGHSDTAAVVFGDYEEDGHVTEFEVDLSDADNKSEVVLQFNAHNANATDEYGWSAYDDDNVSITDVDGDSQLSHGEPLPAHGWDLSVGNSLADDEWELESEHDRDILQITPRSSIGDITLETAPTNQNLNDFDDYEDANITETNTVANQDHLILTVEDFGAEGAVDAGDWDSGIYVELEEQNTGPIGDATVWNSSDESDEDLSVELVNEEDYNGDLIYTVDYETADLESDEDYDVRFNVTEDNEYIDDEDEEFGQETELSLEDREVEWDTISQFPADGTATGTTNVAPGTELNARADSSTEQGSFVELADAEVTEGDDGAHEFSASWPDLEDEEPGVLFDMIVEDPYSDAEDTVEDVELLEPDADTEAAFDVSAEAPDNVEVGDDATLDVTINNNGDMAGATNYTVVIDGETEDDHELELNGSESYEESYEFDTSAEGDIDWSVETDDDSQSGTLSVGDTDMSDDDDDGDADNNGDADENGDDDDDDDDDDDGTPGFGVAVALFALLAAAMLALRQQH